MLARFQTKYMAVVALGVATANAPAAAQSAMTGVVREDSTGRQLGGVEVLIEATKRSTRTDSAGRYLIEAPAGKFIATFRAIGYHAVQIHVEVARRDTAHTDVSLVHDAGQKLDSVVVSGRNVRRTSTRDMFDERRKLGMGKFIDSTVLRQAESSRLSDVLRINTGVRMVNYQEQAGNGGHGPNQVRAASPIQMGMDGGTTCWVTVVYDGVTMYRPGSRTPPPDFSRDFNVSSLQAVEYYKSAAEVPMEFGGRGTDCGVLVLWSRR